MRASSAVRVALSAGHAAKTLDKIHAALQANEGDATKRMLRKLVDSARQAAAMRLGNHALKILTALPESVGGAHQAAQVVDPMLNSAVAMRPRLALTVRPRTRSLSSK